MNFFNKDPNKIINKINRESLKENDVIEYRPYFASNKKYKITNIKIPNLGWSNSQYLYTIENIIDTTDNKIIGETEITNGKYYMVVEPQTGDGSEVGKGEGGGGGGGGGDKQMEANRLRKQDEADRLRDEKGNQMRIHGWGGSKRRKSRQNKRKNRRNTKRRKHH